jgi:hypothetical protein
MWGVGGPRRTWRGATSKSVSSDDQTETCERVAVTSTRCPGRRKHPVTAATRFDGRFKHDAYKQDATIGRQSRRMALFNTSALCARQNSLGAEKKTNTERLSKANAWREVTMSRPRRAASMGQEYAGAAEEDDVQPLAGMLGFF